MSYYYFIDYYIDKYYVICLHVLRKCTYVHSNVNAICFNKS